MLTNQICFITGSSGGIGWAIAKLFAKYGATIILNGRNIDKLKCNLETLKQISDRNHTYIHADISNNYNIKEIYKKIFSEYKRLDVLVNNAGILQDALLGMINEEMVDNLIATNQKAVLFNLQYASKIMQRYKKGSIINISSIIGQKGNSGQIAYGCTKSAVIGITLSASKELASQNIRVNAIAPGFIETEMIKNVPKEKYDILSRSILMGRVGKADDVAKVALFFASELSEYVTGQVITVDGGMII